LSRDDFNGLRLALSKGKTKDELGPATMKRRLTIARMVFANHKEIYGTALKNPAQRLLRESRKRNQYYQAEEVRHQTLNYLSPNDYEAENAPVLAA